MVLTGKVFTATSLAIFLQLGFAAIADTVRWGPSSDALTLDPHAVRDLSTSALQRQIFEPLIARGSAGRPIPMLATEWSPTSSLGTSWIFKLREGVRFHDGAEFDSSDVVFSINRAISSGPYADELRSAIKEVRANGLYEVQILTDGPRPALLPTLTKILIMDQDWAHANNALEVQDFNGGEETFTSLNANGTGPYKLVSRESGVKTVLVLNENYWGTGEFTLEITRIIHTPIQDYSTRITSLQADDVDFIQGVSINDFERLSTTEGLSVYSRPSGRVVFLGLDQRSSALRSTENTSGNPFRNKNVREAFSLAIDRDLLQREILREVGRPTGTVVSQDILGWQAALDAYSSPDTEKAKSLMNKAGYSSGFSVTLNCPKGQYFKDEDICLAVSSMLSSIGVQVDLEISEKSSYFKELLGGGYDFYILGWKIDSEDPGEMSENILHSNGNVRRSWNFSFQSEGTVDELVQSARIEVNVEKREQIFSEIFGVVKNEILLIPLYEQLELGATKSNLLIVADSNGAPDFRSSGFDQTNTPGTCAKSACAVGYNCCKDGQCRKKCK